MTPDTARGYLTLEDTRGGYTRSAADPTISGPERTRTTARRRQVRIAAAPRYGARRSGGIRLQTAEVVQVVPVVLRSRRTSSVLALASDQRAPNARRVPRDATPSSR